MIVGRINKTELLLKDTFSESKEIVGFLKSTFQINEIIEDLTDGQNIYIDKNKNLHVKEIKEGQILE